MLKPLMLDGSIALAQGQNQPSVVDTSVTAFLFWGSLGTMLTTLLLGQQGPSVYDYKVFMPRGASNAQSGESYTAAVASSP